MQEGAIILGVDRIFRGLKRIIFGQQLRTMHVGFATLPKLAFKRPRVRNAGQMHLGHNLVFRCPVTRAQMETSKSGRLVIGDEVYINEAVIIAAECSITIGDNVRIGDFVTIHDSNYHESDPTHPPRIAPVVIGRNAWLGRNVSILPGVTIGENSVIAAGAIVLATVPANVLAGGNPVRVLRHLVVPQEYVRG